MDVSVFPFLQMVSFSLFLSARPSLRGLSILFFLSLVVVLCAFLYFGL